MVTKQESKDMRDPARVASDVVGVLMENERVRVLGSTLRPGEKAAMHSHPDYVVYVVRGGTIQLTYPNGKAETMELEKGKAMFMAAQIHEVINVGDTEVEMVVLELK